MIRESLYYPLTIPFEGSLKTYELVKGSAVIYHRRSLGEESGYSESAMAHHCSWSSLLSGSWELQQRAFRDVPAEILKIKGKMNSCVVPVLKSDNIIAPVIVMTDETET